MSRRSLLTSAAAAAAGTIIAPAAASAHQPAAAQSYGDWSTVTYLPLVCQKQLADNQKTIKDTPYQPFFDPDVSVPSAAAEALRTGPLDLSLALTPSAENVNRILDPDYKTPDNGYAVLGDQMAYAQSRIVMPGVTTEMFRWWFTWHPLERQRYMLWFPQAHIDTEVQDPARLRNESLTYDKRLYGNSNRIQEWIGPSRLDAIINFSDPTELGFDPATIKRAGITASASAVSFATPAPDIAFTLLVHVARDAAGGMELFSRYWIGAHPDMARFKNADKAPAFLNKIGFNTQVAEATAYEMSVHDLTEFNHLARILPKVYAQFG